MTSTILLAIPALLLTAKVAVLATAALLAARSFWMATPESL